MEKKASKKKSSTSGIESLIKKKISKLRELADSIYITSFYILYDLRNYTLETI